MKNVVTYYKMPLTVYLTLQALRCISVTQNVPKHAKAIQSLPCIAQSKFNDDCCNDLTQSLFGMNQFMTIEAEETSPLVLFALMPLS